MKKIYIIILLITTNLFATDYTRINIPKVPNMKEKVSQPDVSLSFSSKSSVNLFYPTSKSANKTNLFEFGCNGIRYTGAVEDAIIDDILSLKQQLKAMTDPITKMNKLDAYLFSYALIKCSINQFKCAITGEGEHVVSGEKQTCRYNLKDGAWSRSLANSNTEVTVKVNTQVGSTANMKTGMTTDTQLDFTGFLKDVWNSLEQNETFKDTMACTMDVRKDTFKKLYEMFNRKYNLQLGLTTLSGMQCNAALIREGEKVESWDELLGGSLSQATSWVVNKFAVGSPEKEKIATLSVEDKNILKEKLHNAMKNVKGDSTQGVADGVVVNIQSETGENCGGAAPTINSVGEAEVNCYNSSTGQMNKRPITFSPDYGTKVAQKIWGTNEYNGGTPTNILLAKETEPYNSIYATDQNGRPAMSFEDEQLAKELLGNKLSSMKLEEAKPKLRTVELNDTDFEQELLSAALYMEKENGGYEPTYLSYFFKQINNFSKIEKQKIVNYFFKKGNYFENNYAIHTKKVINQQATNTNKDEFKNNQDILRNWNNYDTYEIRFNVYNPNNATGNFEEKMLENMYFQRTSGEIFLPKNDFTETIMGIYLTKCNDNNILVDDTKYKDLVEIVKYYNEKYTYKLGLDRFIQIIQSGLPEEEKMTTYRKIIGKEYSKYLWVNNIHLEYLYFVRESKKALVEMINGFKCNITAHTQLIKDLKEDPLPQGVFDIYTKYNENNPDTNEPFKIIMTFSTKENIFNEDTIDIRFNNKLKYYKLLNESEFNGSYGNLKNISKRLLKEIERKMFEKRGLDEDITAFNELKGSKEANIKDSMRKMNSRGHNMKEQLEIERMIYIKNMSKYFK